MIHNLACLSRAYEEGRGEKSPQEERDREDLRGERGRSKGEEKEEDEKESHFDQSRVEESRRGKVQRRDNGYGGENYSRSHEDFSLKASHLVVSLTELSSTHATPGSVVLKRCVTPAGSLSDKKLPTCLPPHSQLRRNTLPSLTVDPPLLHLPPLGSQSTSHLQVPTQVSPAKSRTMVFLPHPPSSSPPSKASVRPALLPPLPSASSITSLVPPSASCYNERNRRSLRRHSVQLEQLKGGTRMNYLDM